MDDHIKAEQVFLSLQKNKSGQLSDFRFCIMDAESAVKLLGAKKWLETSFYLKTKFLGVYLKDLKYFQYSMDIYSMHSKKILSESLPDWMKKPITNIYYYDEKNEDISFMELRKLALPNILYQKTAEEKQIAMLPEIARIISAILKQQTLSLKQIQEWEESLNCEQTLSD